MVAGVLHDGEVALGCRRRHQCDRDAAFRCLVQQPQRVQIGKKVRILNDDLALRCRDRDVVQPLHSARRLARRDVRDVQRRVAHALEPRKVVFTRRNDAGGAHPVIEERRLHLADSRPLDPHGGVAPSARMLARAAPHVGDAVAERVRDTPVDHHDLAMIAVVVPGEFAESRAMKNVEVAACFSQRCPHCRVGLDCAALIDEHAHSDAVGRFSRQRRRDAVGDGAVLPEKGFEMDVMLRGVDVVEQRAEERVVLDDRDAIAVDDAAPCQRRHRAKERGDIGVRRQVDVDFAPAAFPPDHVGEDYGRERERGGEHRARFDTAKIAPP